MCAAGYRLPYSCDLPPPPSMHELTMGIKRRGYFAGVCVPQSSKNSSAKCFTRSHSVYT